MEPSSTSMIRCVNRRDTRWIATWRRLSASWTPNQPQRPKQEENAATMGEKRSTGANGNSGLIRMGQAPITTCEQNEPAFLLQPQNGENFMLLRAQPLCYRWTRAFIYQETHLCWFQQRYKCGVCKRLCGKQ